MHVDYRGERRLGGDSGKGPRWTWDDVFEKPNGVRVSENGSYKEIFYDDEQQ